MTQDTSARLIGGTGLDGNTAAMADALRLLPFVPGVALDCRYGFGSWARELRRRFPKLLITGYETDPWVTRRAWRDDLVNLKTEPFDPATHSGRYDLIAGDFNMVTRIDRAPLDGVLSLLPLAVIFTDVACNKLHLNYKAYGLASPDLDAYWDGWDVPGYRLAGYSRRQFAASTALFVRNDQPCL